MATRMTEKAENRRVNRDNRPTAHLRHIRMSPTKARLVLDVIRGMKYIEAAAVLQNIPNAAAPIVKKLVDSAAANAEMKDYSKNELVVLECRADVGPTLKRMIPKGKGSSARILKRTCHLSVILGREDERRI